MKDRTYSLLSFSTYLNKGCDLRAHARQMSDARTDPGISPASVFLALIHVFVFRLPQLAGSGHRTVALLAAKLDWEIDIIGFGNFTVNYR